MKTKFAECKEITEQAMLSNKHEIEEPNFRLLVNMI